MAKPRSLHQYNPLFVEGMTKVQVREAYGYSKISFQHAVEQVCTTRDPENYRAKEKALRTRQWQERENAKRAQHAS